jgi:hypothetical protein
MQEIWKPVPGYETRYEVSNYGRVRSHVIGTGTKGETHYLKHDRAAKYGHSRVTLSMNRKTERFFVHRLVAAVFIGSPPTPDHQVNHLDFDPQNNRVDNLEWVTLQENNRYSKHRFARGERHHSAKLSAEQVREIRTRYENGETQVALAAFYKISQPHCERLVHRKSWKHVL